MINSDKKPFTAVAVKDDGLGGTSLPKPQIPTYPPSLPKQQTTNQTAGQTTNRITKGTDQKKPDTYETTAVTADDFLRGFNEGYEEDLPTQAPPQQTTNQPPKPLPGNSARKTQNSRGVTRVAADDVLRDFSNTGNPEQLSYEAQKEQLRREAEEEQAQLMDPRNQNFQMTSLPDTPIAQYIYYLRQLMQSPKQVQYEQFVADELKTENQAVQEDIRDWARDHNVSASIVSLLTSPLKVLDYFNGLMETAVSGHKRPSGVPSFTETTNVIRDEVGENIAEEYGEAARFVYNTAMSGADTAIAGLTGNVSGAIILGAGTASDTASDVMERGGTEEEALIGGAVSGIMEGIFERFSLSELEAMKLLPVNTVKDVVGNITKSVVTNAGEEFSTELTNTVFDTIFMDELSTYALTVQGYMSQGRSEADARQLAGEDILKRLGESAMSGALMGVLFGGGASASGYHRAQLAARGDAKLLSGEMPTPRELEAMNLSDAEARGAMVLLNLDQADGDAIGGHLTGNIANQGNVYEHSPVNVDLKYKRGWTDAQKAEADAKVKALTEAKTVKTPVTRKGTSAASRYKSVYGESSVPLGYDVDHTVDLQLGGADDISNLKPLERSVNRSLGKQVGNAIKRYPYETEFGEFTIH